MTLGSQLIAFFAGIIGGLAFVQLYTGEIWGIILAYLSPLPLFLAGLTGGSAAAITAALFGILAVFLRTNPDSTIFFACIIALPVMTLTRIALIRDDRRGYIDGGTVLLAALTIGTILMAIVAAMLEIYSSGIGAVTQSLLDSYKAMLLENGTQQLTPEQIDDALMRLKGSLPALLLVSWFLIISVGGIFAQWFSSEIGKNLRPTPFLKEIYLPSWMAIVTVLCMIGAIMAPSDTSMVLTAFTTLYMIGFTIVGLGAMHRWINTRAIRYGWSDNRRLFTYIFAYLAIMILQVPVLFLLLGGLIAPFTAKRLSSRTVTPEQSSN